MSSVSITLTRRTVTVERTAHPVTVEVRRLGTVTVGAFTLAPATVILATPRRPVTLATSPRPLVTLGITTGPPGPPGPEGPPGTGTGTGNSYFPGGWA